MIAGRLICWWLGKHDPEHRLGRSERGVDLVFTRCRRCGWRPKPDPVELARSGPENDITPFRLEIRD